MSDDGENQGLHSMVAPLMEAVGHVAHHWARLEYEINKTIWVMAATSPSRGACITAQIPSILPRFRALIALVEMDGGSRPLVKELNKFSATADALARRRNRVVHDPWFFRELRLEDQAFIEFGRLEITADKRLTYEVKPQTRAGVLEVAHDTIAAQKAFIILRAKIYDELREQIELRLGKRIEDFLDFPNLGNDT